MPERKVIEVAVVRSLANEMLRNSAAEHGGQREGVCMLLEAILSAAGAHHGYGEFSVDGQSTEDYGLRRQYYGPPNEGVTLMSRQSSA